MKPKKSLGQNFLRDGKVLERIIQAADLSRKDNVIEIGPGEGVLTRELAKRANKLICVEKDERLAEDIARKFQIQNSKITNGACVISEDILKVNLPELIEENDFKNYKVVANIPYYITSPIIQLFLETKYPPTEMILMVQKEVAERICARPSKIVSDSSDVKNAGGNASLDKNRKNRSILRGKPGQMSILAVSVQYYAKPEILFYVDKKSFWPIPEVDSAVIKISKIKNQKSKLETQNFFRIVRAGFSAKRKMLANNLSTSFHLEKYEAEEKIKKAGLRPTQRAQELSVEDWKKLKAVLEENDPS